MRKIVIILGLILFLAFISSAIAETDIITYKQLKNYGQLFENDGKKGLVPVKIEAVIGKINVDEGYSPDTYIDFWIKDENGYGFDTKQIYSSLKELTGFPHEVISGQRVIYEILPYADGSFSGGNIISYEIIEEGVDYSAIEEHYKATSYESLSYKKLLRNIDDYRGKNICVEGVYLQNIENKYNTYYALLMDDEANIYYFSYSTDWIPIKLLLNDRLKLYGYIPPKMPTYEYLSFTGQRTVPYISVNFVDLLEDE